MFMLLRLPFKIQQVCGKLLFRFLVHLALCLCSANTGEDALDCLTWTLVSAKEVFDSNEASGIASIAMLSAAQE